MARRPRRNREALVEWAGFDVSAAGGGAAWSNEWVPRGRLTADLRAGARIRPYAARKRPAETAADAFAEAEARVAGRRTSARLAGGARAFVTYAGGERVVVRRGGARTAPQHVDGSGDGDVTDTGV